MTSMKRMPNDHWPTTNKLNNCFVKLFDIFKENTTPPNIENEPAVTQATLKKKVSFNDHIIDLELESKKLNLQDAMSTDEKQSYEYKRHKNTVKRKSTHSSGKGRKRNKSEIKKSPDLLLKYLKPCQSNNNKAKDELDTNKNTCMTLHGSNLPTLRNCYVKLKDVFTELNTTHDLPNSDIQISTGSSDVSKGEKLKSEITKSSRSMSATLLSPKVQESFRPKRQLTLKLFKLDKRDIINIMGKKECNIKNKLNKETKVKKQKLTPVLNTESTSDSNIQGNQAEAPFELITVEYIVSEDPTFHGTIVQIVDSCDQDITHKFMSPHDASDENTVPLILGQAIL